MWRPFRRKREAYPPVTFQIPGAPPTGSRVRSARTGDVFRRQPASRIAHALYDATGSGPDLAEVERVLLLWGLWLRDGTEEDEEWAWGAILAGFGPVVLLDDDQDQEQADLYGPVGQRWGDPDRPCPYDSCVLGSYHVGAHEIRKQIPAPAGMDFVPDLSGQSRTDLIACTCSRPQAHLPGCTRYAQMAGPSHDSPAI